MKGPAIKRPPDWKGFLSNNLNKVPNIQVLLKVWSSDGYANKLHGRQIILIYEGPAYKLTSSDGKKTDKTEITPPSPYKVKFTLVM